MAQSATTHPTVEPQGLWSFTIIWFGQVVSLMGSGLTTFGVGVWAYQQTGSATLFALITLAGTLPVILASPLAGVLVDRWDRRRVLIACDAGSAAVTLGLFLLTQAVQFNIWYFCVAVALNAVIKAFQEPAYIATTTLLIPKSHYTRASGMVQFGSAVAEVLAPLLGGVLVVAIGLRGILLIDFVTFLFAALMLLMVQIPQLPAGDTATTEAGSLLTEAGFGWNYIVARRGLLGMLIYFVIVNFAFNMIAVLSLPMILSFTDPATLGLVGSAGGLGMLLGSILLSTWGGPKRRVHGFLGFGIAFGLSLMLAGMRPSAILVGIASFLCLFCVPFISGCSQVIWQLKIPPEIQGRVFATRLMVQWSCIPLAYLIAGPLADNVFNPLLVENGALAASVGQIIGTGPGRGIGLLIVIVGSIPVWAAIGGYLYRPLRMVEQILPDAIVDDHSTTTIPPVC